MQNRHAIQSHSLNVQTVMDGGEASVLSLREAGVLGSFVLYPLSTPQLVSRAVGGHKLNKNQTTSFPRNFYPHLFIGVRGNKTHQPGVIRKREA